MAKYKLEEILQDDPLGLLDDVKPKNPVLTENDRLVGSFEEIIHLWIPANMSPKRI